VTVNGDVPKVGDPMKERDVKAHMLRRVAALGGFARKVRWEGRRDAPDWRIAVPGTEPFWVELKRPGERPTLTQLLEHDEMRAHGEIVLVFDSTDSVDAVLGSG
jgi:hypothetical protein